MASVVTLSIWWIVAGVAALCFLGAVVAFRVGERVEDIKRELIDFMLWLRDQGFEYCDDLVQDIVVEDASGAADRLRSWFKVLKNPATRETVLLKFLSKQATMAMENPAKREKLLEIVDDWKTKDKAARRKIAAQIKAEEAAATAAKAGATEPAEAA